MTKKKALLNHGSGASDENDDIVVVDVSAASIPVVIPSSDKGKESDANTTIPVGIPSPYPVLNHGEIKETGDEEALTCVAHSVDYRKYLNACNDKKDVDDINIEEKFSSSFDGTARPASVGQEEEKKKNEEDDLITKHEEVEDGKCTINNIELGFDSNREGEGEEWTKYPADCYSFLALFDPIHNPGFFFFGLMVVAFQIGFLSLMVLRVAHKNLSTNGDVDNPDSGDEGLIVGTIKHEPSLTEQSTYTML